MRSTWKIKDENGKSEYLIFKGKYMCTYILHNHEDHEALLKKMTFKDVEPIRYQDIKDVILNESDNELTVKWEFNEVEERELKLAPEITKEVKELLETKFKNITIKNYSILKQLLPIIIAFGFIVFFTCASYAVALGLESGDEMKTSGRNSFLKKMLVLVASILGPIGSIVVGSIVCLLLIYIAYRVYKNPRKGIVAKFTKEAELLA